MTPWIRRFPVLTELVGFGRGAAGWATGRRAQACPSDAAPSTDALRLEPALHELRGQAMRRMFPKLFPWRASRREQGVAVDVHAYLAQATSPADLEQRIGAVERRRQFQS